MVTASPINLIGNVNYQGLTNADDFKQVADAKMVHIISTPFHQSNHLGESGYGADGRQARGASHSLRNEAEAGRFFEGVSDNLLGFAELGVLRRMRVAQFTRVVGHPTPHCLRRDIDLKKTLQRRTTLRLPSFYGALNGRQERGVIMWVGAT